MELGQHLSRTGELLHTLSTFFNAIFSKTRTAFLHANMAVWRLNLQGPPLRSAAAPASLNREMLQKKVHPLQALAPRHGRQLAVAGPLNSLGGAHERPVPVPPSAQIWHTADPLVPGEPVATDAAAAADKSTSGRFSSSSGTAADTAVGGNDGGDGGSSGDSGGGGGGDGPRTDAGDGPGAAEPSKYPMWLRVSDTTMERTELS